MKECEVINKDLGAWMHDKSLQQTTKTNTGQAHTLGQQVMMRHGRRHVSINS